MKLMVQTLTVVLVAKDKEHPIEETADMQRALSKVVIPWLEVGATAGRKVFNVPHTHMGENDNAEYEVVYRLESEGKVAGG